jgi:hypothetical protein
VLEVTERLGKKPGTLALGLVDRAVEGDIDGLRESDLPPTPRRRIHAFLARLLRVRPPYAGASFAELIRRARLEQSLASDLEAAYLVSGSCLVELLGSGAAGAEDRELHQRMLYAEVARRIPLATWLRALRRDPAVWLVNALSLARMRAPDLLVLLSPDEGTRRVAELLRRTHRTELLGRRAGRRPAGRGCDRRSLPARCPRALTKPGSGQSRADPNERGSR